MVPSVVKQDEHVRVCFVVADPINEAALRVCASERLQINETTVFNVDRLRLCGCGKYSDSCEDQYSSGLFHQNVKTRTRGSKFKRLFPRSVHSRVDERPLLL